MIKSTTRNKINLTKVRRLPPIKILRSVHLGLTFALIFSVAAVLLYEDGTFITTLLAVKIAIIFLLFLFTYFGGWTFGGAAIAWLITHFIYDNVTLELLSQFYTLGFLFGYILAQIYNHFVHKMKIWQKNYKIAFFYDQAKAINIIKSPNENELNEDWGNLTDKEKELIKLYNYKVPQPVPAPFTITILANPNVRTNSEDAIESIVEPDPILQDEDLFILSVDKLLHSLESDSVIGRPEIWSRVRVITIFDKKMEKTKAQTNQQIYFTKRFEFQLMHDEEKQPENILAPARKMWNTFLSLVTEMKKDNNSEMNAAIDKIIRDTDVLYAFSAHTNYIRASALYGDGDEGANEYAVLNEQDDKIFDIKPMIGGNDNKQDFIHTETRTSRHEAGTAVPGKIALNVLTATRKTYLHEFAHAMSSIKNGAITDEYFDTWDIGDQTTAAEPTKATDSPFYINRLERIPGTISIPPIPHTFIQYNGSVYNSDVQHPSGEENWVGYFPERKNCTAGCIMDRTYGSYQFDDLLSQFIYDRMMTKVNRTQQQR